MIESAWHNDPTNQDKAMVCAKAGAEFTDKRCQTWGMPTNIALLLEQFRPVLSTPQFRELSVQVVSAIRPGSDLQWLAIAPARWTATIVAIDNGLVDQVATNPIAREMTWKDDVGPIVAAAEAMIANRPSGLSAARPATETSPMFRLWRLLAVTSLHNVVKDVADIYQTVARPTPSAQRVNVWMWWAANRLIGVLHDTPVAPLVLGDYRRSTGQAPCQIRMVFRDGTTDTFPHDGGDVNAVQIVQDLIGGCNDRQLDGVAGGRRVADLSSVTVSAPDLPAAAQPQADEDVGLPDLVRDCPSCPDEKQRQHSRDQANAWHERESQAHTRWRDRQEQDGAFASYEAWTRTDEYAALGPVPQDLPDRGCLECAFTGHQPTAAGEQVLRMLRLCWRQG